MRSVKASKAYELIRLFIEALNNKDKGTLSSEFGISEDVYEEIVEALSGYDECTSIWSPPPLRGAFDRKGNLHDFDFYEMNQPGVWGGECRLWHGDQRAEPIFHAEFAEVDDKLIMVFRYIEN